MVASCGNQLWAFDSHLIPKEGDLDGRPTRPGKLSGPDHFADPGSGEGLCPQSIVLRNVPSLFRLWMGHHLAVISTGVVQAYSMDRL